MGPDSAPDEVVADLPILPGQEPGTHRMVGEYGREQARPHVRAIPGAPGIQNAAVRGQVVGCYAQEL